MSSSLEFLLGRLDENDSAFVARADFEGEHGDALRLCQARGFIGAEPGMNSVPSCPYCEEGVPYRLGERLLCQCCSSTVDRRDLLLWALKPEAFLCWLAAELQLRGGVRRIDACLWQLGTLVVDEDRYECFFRRNGFLSAAGKIRLKAFQRSLVFCGTMLPPEHELGTSRYLSLLELLRLEETLSVTDVRPLLRGHGIVRFDAESGVLWVGGSAVGEVPVGSKEYFFLRSLAQNLDRFVPYADLKQAVLRQAESRDTTEEATFCQNLKSRIKKKWIPRLDELLVTTNKADGYRLRGVLEA